MNTDESKKTIVETIVKRVGNLATVKSIVTLVLTGVFAYLSCKGAVAQEFMSIYTMIVGFYFGTQANKGEG
ncbi:MAG: hypothetical protein NC131_08985 [Roseburia sp.]|nr:hypothetical protein [Roseburia sp.]